MPSSRSEMAANTDVAANGRMRRWRADPSYFGGLNYAHETGFRVLWTRQLSPCKHGVVADNMYKKTKPGLSAKEAAKDVPSWAMGQRPLTTENGRQFAERLLDDRFGKGNYPTGPGSEFNKIKKWGDRAFA